MIKEFLRTKQYLTEIRETENGCTLTLPRKIGEKKNKVYKYKWKNGIKPGYYVNTKFFPTPMHAIRLCVRMDIYTKCAERNYSISVIDYRSLDGREMEPAEDLFHIPLSDKELNQEGDLEVLYAELYRMGPSEDLDTDAFDLEVKHSLDLLVERFLI